MSKPPRTALPLPRYVERKPLKRGGWGYFFHVPSWARRRAARYTATARHRLRAAVSRAETILLPAFDAWRTGGAALIYRGLGSAHSIGCLRNTGPIAAITKLDPKSKRNHEVGFKLVGGYVLKDGKRLGEKRLAAIDTALIDDLYEKLLILKVTDEEAMWSSANGAPRSTTR